MSRENVVVRRWVPVGFALGWYALVLALVPFGRGIVDFFRSRGLLVVGTTVGMALLVALLVVVGRAAQRRGWIEPRVWLVGFGLAVVLVAAAQLLPRAEERWHVVEYGVLGFLCWYAVPPTAARRVVWAALLAAGAGWLDEGIQLILPDRVYDWWDVGLNAASGLAGAILPAISLRAAKHGIQRGD